MNIRQDLQFPAETVRALPQPSLQRWQPLRLGVIELFYYDSEEFWFKDGHLLLRGNNGTGKSKVLSLTMPLLLDANLKPSRVEPDGDSTKKMAWNLLLGTTDRRMGYTWIEFGRVDPDGTLHFLTLGAGLLAAAAKPRVESWFFVLEGAGDGPRVNQDLWLMSKGRVVLTKEKLREQVSGRGHVFDTAEAYRRAVDERLYQLGHRRYDALIDTLIQLRQPQLSKKPDETLLSNALSEALPPIRIELLGDVATALGQLEDDRQELDEYEALARAVGRFDTQYRTYAGTQARRSARRLRQAQTEFDNASQARTKAHETFAEAHVSEQEQSAIHEAAELAVTEEQARYQALQDSPGMRDARRLSDAKSYVERRESSAEAAHLALTTSQLRLAKERNETGRSKKHLTEAEHQLAIERSKCTKQAEDAALGEPYAANDMACATASTLVDMSSKDIEGSQSRLRERISERRDNVKHVRRLIAILADAEADHALKESRHEAAVDLLNDANERRAVADESFENAGRDLLAAWTSHFASLKQLDPDREALHLLADWVVRLNDENPALRSLLDARDVTSRRLASARVELEAAQRAVREEQHKLTTERQQLTTGVDAEPAPPLFRDTSARLNRPGAPFWKLVDFTADVPDSSRAGLEAALQASGILDAWVSPTGALLSSDGRPLIDETLQARPATERPLSFWLIPSLPPDCDVPADAIESVLQGISCTDGEEAEDTASETWISVDGRYRLGALAGGWQKAQADFIGFAARAAARARRLQEIEARLLELDELSESNAESEAELKQADALATSECADSPRDDALRNASSQCASIAREISNLRVKLAQAETVLKLALDNVDAETKKLSDDAGDLGLPYTPEALDEVQHALGNFSDHLGRLFQAVTELRIRWPLYEEQLVREDDAAQAEATDTAALEAAKTEAVSARATYETLRESVGLKVDELMAQLSLSKAAVATKEDERKKANKLLREAIERRAVAEANAKNADSAYEQKLAERSTSVTYLQAFAASGMLAAGAPEVTFQDVTVPWTIDPALTTARRLEQVLSNVKADDDAWTRVQSHIHEDYADLQRALTAISYQSIAEQTDFGLVVTVIYQNRPERPDQLAMRLTGEIEERKELLTAKEREVLENHLQAEIAAEVQRLLRSADEHVNAINKELDKRPTSTGVRFTLKWTPLSEQDGAPVGLDAAKERLLNVSSDLWSQEDRRVVGAMLQQRITAERERADAGGAKENAGGLHEQLARALDYRRWHRFSVMRSTPRGWAKLSGPASSGERALGLTVPLFAAVASFYGDSAKAICPRIILLDEVFAGIDDGARAHCWALIREFDLDFIITSEREWACSVELPGVSICHLLKREGVDAVFVSRWEWDGRSKRRLSDPNRRFGPPS
ncbi:TIGR02680 family protein [Burkholderia sp. Ac-20345]|uniref:TIGR02680 family protein n=1 Tax=Burkholderia sp. Ac-20345 TaxID=2703891 RepID=UPI00197B2939|nr:TIGR02680 family protein [Burkholderia sp. Ac-20345]MBN3777267.1 TIGR02680 family protein [Burkholderia sp. Ac-20345]